MSIHRCAGESGTLHGTNSDYVGASSICGWKQTVCLSLRGGRLPRRTCLLQMDYWTVSRGVAVRNGFSCRECKKCIDKGLPIVVRDGRKMRFFYHLECFSGDADPRTQQSSTFNEGKFQEAISKKAPESKGYGKWYTSQYGYNPALSVQSVSVRCLVFRVLSIVAGIERLILSILSFVLL